MLPKITALFRMVKDPEFKVTPGGLEVCSLYMAASEKYKDKETQLFISATAFGKTAEFIANIKKGQRVYCTGKLQTESWESNGERKSKITMIIDSFEYVEKKDATPAGQSADYQPQPQQPAEPGKGAYQPQQNNYNQSGQAPFEEEFEPDKEIPF